VTSSGFFIPQLRCITSHKSEYLIYAVSEALNQICKYYCFYTVACFIINVLQNSRIVRYNFNIVHKIR